MDNKRLVLAIGLCIGVLVLWNVAFPPAKNPPAPPPAPVAGQTTPAPAVQPAQPGAPGAPAAPAGTGTAAPAAAPVANRPERLVELQTPEVRFVFSSLGGTLVHAQLREKQFLDKTDDPTSGHDVVRTLETKDGSLRTTFTGFPTPPDGAWEVSQPSPESVVFAADSGTFHVEKRYRVDKRYRLQLDVVVANRSDKPLMTGNVLLTVNGRQDPDKRGGGFFSAGSANVSSAVCFVNESVERKAIDAQEKDALRRTRATGRSTGSRPTRSSSCWLWWPTRTRRNGRGSAGRLRSAARSGR
jgi:YidC/Oxa1 family membrane protein insertase